VPKVSLIDDDQWHTATFDLYSAIKKKWPDAGRITEFEWFTDSNATVGQQFWFDEFNVTRRSYVSGFDITLLPSSGNNGRGFDAADVDGDGNMDLARGRSAGGEVHLYKGDGNNGFTISLIGDPGNDPYGVVLADFDNDNKIDFFANNSSTGDPYFFKGNGNSTFQAGVYEASLDPNNYASLDNYDFDNDGNQDVVLANHTNRQLWFYPGNGDATFGSRVLIGNPFTNTLGIAAPSGRVVGQPFAELTQSAEMINEGENVGFDAGGSYDDGSIVSYDWDFGDGNTDSGQSVNNTFAGEGDFAVVLTVTDDEEKQDRNSLKVRVMGTPPVSDPGGPYIFDEDKALNGSWTGFLNGTASSDAETSIKRYEWDFDDSDGIGIESTEATPRITYDAVGVYTVTLTVYDEVEQSHTATTTVTVANGDIPTANFTGPVALDENDASLGEWTGWYGAENSSDTEGAASYTIDWDDGSSSTIQPLWDNFEDGNYTSDPTWTVYGGTWNVSNGVLQQTNTGAAWRWLQDLTRTYKDFSLELDFKGTGVTDGSMGIVFHNPNTKGSTNTFRLYSQESWDYWRFDDWNTNTTLVDGGTGWNPDIWYHLRLVVVGDNTKLFVTPEGGVESLQIETTSVAHPEGGIGLIAHTQHVLYDNVKVIPLDTEWKVNGMRLGDFTHSFTGAGDMDVTLTVTDHAGQTDSAGVNTNVSANDPPVANPGGPYLLTEDDAWDGKWDFILDASGSTDDVGIQRYTIDFGDGNSYTTGFGDGSQPGYFAAGTDLYGYDTQSAYPRFIIATEDNTQIDIIDLATNSVIASNTLNRFQSWNANTVADGTYFKVKSDKPVVAYETNLNTHSAFAPSLDGDPVGNEFILYYDINHGFYVFAIEDTVVRVYKTNGDLAAELAMRAGTYWDPGLSGNTYRFVSTGLVSMQTVGLNGYTTVPSINGSAVGREFYGATYTSTAGAVAMFAYEPADIEIFDMDSGASLFTHNLAVGEMWFESGIGTRRMHIVSSGDIEVWAGDNDGSGIENLGDDISMTTGRNGTEFYIHNLRDGIVIFAPNNGTDIDIDSSAITDTLNRDGFLHLAPADFPSGSGVHHITASKPVVIQTLGRASSNYNDLGTWLGGVSARHRYMSPGTYTVSLTVTDRAGQTDSANTTVEVTQGDPPVAVIDAPATVDESFSIAGEYTVTFDADNSTDDNEIIRYEWDFDDGGTGIGVNPTHIYNLPESVNEQTFTVSLTVTDRAGQQTTTTFDVLVKKGAPPVADAAGPYTFGEESANFGVWTAQLDGTGSTDDFEIFDYQWTFDPEFEDDFSGNILDSDKWLSSGATQDEHAIVAGAGSWDNRYLFSSGNYNRTDGKVFQARISTPISGSAMFGFKNTIDTNFHYNQMPYAIYFSNGTFYVYEDGTNRGNKGTYTRGDTYDIRIVLKNTGARYEVKDAGDTEWTLLYDSSFSSKSLLKVGGVIHTGSYILDDVIIIPVVQGPVVTMDYKLPGVYNVTLRVRDNALLSDTDTTTITIEDSASPTADVGGPYTTEVGSMMLFNGTGSSDDVAVQQYNWTFGDTTGGASDLPFTGKGATPRHFYNQVGSYNVELTVIDNTLKTDTDTTMVDVIVGNPPVANTGGPYQAAVDGPPAYFDGLNSTDDFGIIEYRWDFDDTVDSDGDGDFTNDINGVGARPFQYYDFETVNGQIMNESFSGSAIDSGAWLTAGATQNDALTVVGANSWGNRYVYSVADFDRARISVRGQVRVIETGPTEYAMWGVKNTGTNYSYTQMPHAIYFYDNGDIYIFEAGSSKGVKGTWSRDTLYDVRIDLKISGATYFIKEASSTDWIQLYDSTNRSDSPLKIGATILNGQFEFDNFVIEGLGPYTATLTVEDGAGQTSSATAQVNVAQNLPPHVIAVPWVAHDPITPHETYNGKTIHLKAIVRDAGALTYQWDFGDGTQSAVQAVADKYNLSATHTYPGAPAGTPFVAKIKVWDSEGLMGEDNYNVVVKPQTLNTEVNVAIDEGLWYLHQEQTRSTTDGFRVGNWTSNAIPSATSSSLQSFEINGHLETGDNENNPYVETVDRGLKYLFTQLRVMPIGVQTFGEPDTNGNDIGIENTGGHVIYQGGQVMDAIASSGTPLSRTVTGPADVKRRRYFDIITDMADMYSWGQTEQGNGGGWRYSWNSSIDQSAAQWGAIGLLAAEDIFGIPVPQWVKDRNQVWINNSYSGTGWGYSSPGTTTAGTPSGLVQMALGDQVKTDPRWLTAENWIADNWESEYLKDPGNRHYYALYAFTKSMRLAKPEPVVSMQSNGFDWFNDPDKGLARTLVDEQMANGQFPGTSLIRDQLRSAWGVIMLSQTLFVQPPVADAGRDRVWAVDLPLNFDGSGSFHLDPFRSLVKYEWDFDGDGVFDIVSTDPTATFTYNQLDYPENTLPQTITVTLRVTDNNVPSLTDTDTVDIIIAIPPHPPVAESGGPYTCTAGLPCALDGSGSFDIDPTDFIDRYEWELDNIFPFDFDEASEIEPTYIWNSPGTYNIGLRVWDNAVLNDLDGDGEVDENERLSDQHFTTVTVVVNESPVADVSGPYTVDEGSNAILDGTGSSDPNGDQISYSWDLDNDGQYDDAIGATPSFLGVDDGIFNIGLFVTDTLLDNTASSTVTVNNVTPSADAGPDQVVNEGDQVTFAGSFTDPGTLDTHTLEWNFGDGSQPISGSLTPDHTYAENGVYTVTLTVTDDDGGVGSDSMAVTVDNVAPAVEAGSDRTIDEGDTVDLDPATFTDEGAIDTHTATISWGDGSPEVPGTVVQGARNGTVSGSHVYPAEGVFTVTVTVTDDDGGVGSDAFVVTVDSAVIPNTPPTVDAGPDQIVDEGTGVSFNGSFTDPDTEDTHTIEWNFGDGSPAVSGSLTPNHIYIDNGVYTVTLTVTDNRGGVGSDTMIVTATDVYVPGQNIFDLSARPKSGKVQIVWTSVQEAVHYEIYRKEGNNDYVLINDNHVTDYSTYLDLTLSNGVQYCYKVISVNAQGQKSLYSNEVCATPIERTRRRR
jgi:FOG: PKD repeat